MTDTADTTSPETLKDLVSIPITMVAEGAASVLSTIGHLLRDGQYDAAAVAELSDCLAGLFRGDIDEQQWVKALTMLGGNDAAALEPIATAFGLRLPATELAADLSDEDAGDAAAAKRSAAELKASLLE